MEKLHNTLNNYLKANKNHLAFITNNSRNIFF